MRCRRLDSEHFGCGRFQAPGLVVDGPPVGRHDDVVVELLQLRQAGGEPLPSAFGEDPLPDPVPLALESGAVEGGQDFGPQQVVEAAGVPLPGRAWWYSSSLLWSPSAQEERGASARPAMERVVRCMTRR